MSKYENKVMELFKAAKLSFYREKTFKDLRCGLYRFDFYLPNYCGRPVIVEVDGEQHFKPKTWRPLRLARKTFFVKKIMAIYHEYRTERAYPTYKKEALEQYYKDYKKLNGNSYIDKYHARMAKWQEIYEDYEDE